QMIERGGIGPGQSLSDVIPIAYNNTGSGIRLQRSGWADPTARGAIGFVGDVATDPLTDATAGVVPAVKTFGRVLQETPWLGTAGKVVENVAPKVIAPATEGLMPAGKSVYKAGFKPLDAI